MSTTLPTLQDDPLWPHHLNDALQPLPGLPEALAYIESCISSETYSIALYDNDEDFEGEAAQNKSKLPQRPKPSAILDGLMILRIYAAAASCDQPLCPGQGLISTVVISLSEDRKRFAGILPKLSVAQPNTMNPPTIVIEDGYAAERSIKDVANRIEAQLENGKPVIVGMARPDQLPSTLLTLETLRFTLPPPSLRMLGLMLKLLHPTEEIPVLLTDAELATLPSVHLATVFAAETADEAAASLRRISVRHPPVRTGPTLEDIYGQPVAVAAFRQVAQDIEEWRAGRLDWSEVTKSFLLVGPPGTGKTSLAQAVAVSASILLTKTSYSDCQKMGHQGDMLKELNAVADRAITGAPSVFFLDEIDSFFRRSQSGNGYIIGVINGLLTLLDKLSTSPGVILVAATNDFERIDPAVIRAGRFDRHIEVNLPDRAGLKEFLNGSVSSVIDADHIDRLSDQLLGRTGADLAAVVRDARTRARADRQSLAAAHVQAAADAVQPPISVDLLWRVSVHEAGHLVAGHVFGLPAATSARVTATGGEVIRPGMPSMTPGSLRAFLCAILAGRVAEEVMLGDVSSGAGTGANSDLAQATQLVVNAECGLGFGPTLTWVPPDTPYSLLTEPIRKRIEASLQSAQSEVRAAMERNRAAIEQVATALSRQRELDAPQIAKILASTSAKLG